MQTLSGRVCSTTNTRFRGIGWLRVSSDLGSLGLGYFVPQGQGRKGKSVIEPPGQSPTATVSASQREDKIHDARGLQGLLDGSLPFRHPENSLTCWL